MTPLALAPPILATSPADLAAQIHHHHEQACLSMRDALTHAITAGQLLHQAKLTIEHGAWGSWLAEHFPDSDRTARQYMQLAEARRETPEVLDDLPEPTLNAALKAIARPREPKAADPDRPQSRIVRFDPTLETHVLTIDQLVELVASFGGNATDERVRWWIERQAEPRTGTCPDCNAPILRATVKGETVLASPYEWQPRTVCTKCLQTRHAHPGKHVSCPHCNSTGWTGTNDRPAGRMLAIDPGTWSDTLNVRIIGERTDRRKGEALHQLHECAKAQAA